MFLLLLAFAIFLPLIGFVAYLTSRQTRLILPGHVNNVEVPDPKLGGEHISVDTPSGHTLHGILFPAKATSGTTLIIAFPGNTHNPIGFAAFLRANVFPEDTVAIASLSYRGYPNGITPPSTGKPSQKAMFEDALTIYDALTASLKPAHVKVIGYSIGTTVANHVALHRPVENMVLLAPVASIRRIAQSKYPWLPVNLLLRHPFATEDTIAGLTTPTTLIYTPTDNLVPAYHVERILHTANPALPIISIEGTTHTTLLLSPRIPAILRTALGIPE